MDDPVDHIVIGDGQWDWQPLDEEREVRAHPADPPDVIRVRRRGAAGVGRRVRFDRPALGRSLGTWQPLERWSIEVTAYAADNLSRLRVRTPPSTRQTTSNAT